MMKTKYIKIGTAITLIALFAIQVLWLVNSFFFVKDYLTEVVNDALQQSVEEEAMLRLKSTPKGTKIRSKKSENLPEIVSLQDALTQLGYPLSLSKLDSIVGKSLNECQLAKSEFVLYHVNSKNEVLGKSKNVDPLFEWQTVKSSSFPIVLDSSESVQLVVLNPYRMIVQGLFILILITLIVASFALWGFFKIFNSMLNEKQLFREKVDFSNGVVHNMKMPLGTVMMCFDRITSKEIEDSPEQKIGYITSFKRNMESVISKIDQNLFLFSWEDSQKIIKENVCLIPLIVELENKFKIYYNKDISFILKLDIDSIFANEDLIKEAISNLIDNSIKYSGEKVTITISSFAEDNYDIVKVHDDGIGISEEDQQIIFEKFKRGSLFNRVKSGNPPGFGLGLNYVYQVMKMHEGKVEVNSKEGKFTEFTLYFSNKRELV